MGVQTLIQLFQKQSYRIYSFYWADLHPYCWQSLREHNWNGSSSRKKYGRVQGSWPNVADSGSADSSGWEHYTDTWVPGRQWRGRAALNYKSGSRWKLWKSRKFLYSRTLGFQIQSQICPPICTEGDGGCSDPDATLNQWKVKLGEKLPLLFEPCPIKPTNPGPQQVLAGHRESFPAPQKTILYPPEMYKLSGLQFTTILSSDNLHLQAFRTQISGYWYETWYDIILTHQ